MTPPKLSSLSPTDKIRLAAELDGWKRHADGVGYYRGHHPVVKGGVPLPNYSTSYDTIIPLIQKQSGAVKLMIWSLIHDIYPMGANFLDFTVSQLLDALLVATRKAEL